MSATPKYTNLLKDARCVVIGGTSGIGLGVAEALIEEGARVFVASSSQAKVDVAVKKLSDPAQQYNADPKRVGGATVNLKGPGMEDSIRKLFQSLPKEWNGKVDHVIHTAGDSLAMIPIDQVTHESIAAAGQVRYFSVILTAKVALEFWDKNGTLTITSGSVSKKPRPDWAVVNGFATGLEGLTRGLALDLGNKDDRRIRVNSIFPGPVETPLWDGLPAEAKKGMFDNMTKAALTKKVPDASVVAQAYLGVLKDTNATGHAYYTESGLTLV